MQKKESVIVEINGVTYDGEVTRRMGVDNPKVLTSITVTIDPREQDCSEIDEITEGSNVTIIDKSISGNCTGDYIYKGGNSKQHIFDSK